MIRFSEVCAVFGGTFDPPHVGHHAALAGLFENPGIRRARIIPSAIPVGKATLSSAADRLAMVRICFQDLTSKFDITIDTRELDRAQQNSKPSYTFDTLTDLGRDEKNLAFVMGTDQLLNLEKWHRFPEVLTLSHWIILNRKPHTESLQHGLQKLKQMGLLESAAGFTQSTHIQAFQLKNTLSGNNRYLFVVETDAPALSSTHIREEIARTGEIPPGVLTGSVTTYLKEHALYGSQKRV